MGEGKAGPVEGIGTLPLPPLPTDLAERRSHDIGTMHLPGQTDDGFNILGIRWLRR